MRPGWWIGGIFGVWAAVVGTAEPGVKLENRFVPDETSIYEFALNATGTAVIKGMAAMNGQDLTTPLNLSASGTVRCRVAAVHEDGSGDLALTLDKLSALATGFGQEVSADIAPDRVSVLYNKQEIAPPEAPNWVQKPAVVTMARNGQIVAVKGELLEALRPHPAFSAEWEALVQQLAALRPPFPDEPMFPGQSLDKRYALQLPGGAKPVDVTARFTFKGTETVNEVDCAAIGVEAHVTLADYAFKFSVPLQSDVKFAFTAQQATGEVNMLLHFARADARLIRSEMVAHWQATLSGSLPPPLGQGENVTVEVELQETGSGSLVATPLHQEGQH